MRASNVIDTCEVWGLIKDRYFLGSPYETKILKNVNLKKSFFCYQADKAQKGASNFMIMSRDRDTYHDEYIPILFSK
jgi:hypothetical protein